MLAGFVYILASKPHGTLYIGVTSNLMIRMEEHRRGDRLVYFEEYPLYAGAIRRETSLKRWKRDWKIALIEKANSEWSDLLENWNR